MLHNRAIQVDVVKKNAKDTTPGQGMTFEDKLVMVSVSVERAIKRIGIIVVGYVVLDTVRKIAVEAAKNK